MHIVALSKMAATLPETRLSSKIIVFGCPKKCCVTVSFGMVAKKNHIFKYVCYTLPMWKIASQGPDYPLQWLWGGGAKSNLKEAILLFAILAPFVNVTWHQTALCKKTCFKRIKYWGCYVGLTLICGCNLKPNCLVHSHCEAPAPPTLAAPLHSCQMQCTVDMHYAV